MSDIFNFDTKELWSARAADNAEAMSVAELKAAFVKFRVEELRLSPFYDICITGACMVLTGELGREPTREEIEEKVNEWWEAV